MTGETEILNTAALESEPFGPETGGQSGDIEGLSSVTGLGSKSIAELVEEGQDFENDACQGADKRSNRV